MGKKSFLEDLYVLGKEVPFEGSDQRVWVQKLNSNEDERAIRAANAARAKVLIDKHDEESETSVTLRAQVLDFDTEAAVEYLITPRIREATEKVEARLEGEEEWTENGYLQGLRDAWEAGAKDEWIRGQTDEDAEPTDLYVEANKIYKELERFRDQVDDELRDAIKDIRDDFGVMSEKEIQDRLYDRLYDAMGDIEWMDAYQKAQLAIAVRDPSTRDQIFSGVDDVNKLQDSVLLQLLAAYRALSVDPSEGKDLQETPTS